MSNEKESDRWAAFLRMLDELRRWASSRYHEAVLREGKPK